MHDASRTLLVEPAPRCEQPTSGRRAAVDRGASIHRAREAVRRIVLARDRARGDRRAASGRELWPAMLDGHWHLLDAFTAGAMRYIVAYETPTGATVRRALSQRERSVLELALAGRSGKWIAFELGLSESAIARTLRIALDKLGAGGTAGLAGARTAQFEPLAIANIGVELAVARLTLGAPSLTNLSDAECAIVAGILCGKRVADMARERGTSPRTVSNQIASAYRKLGISSRREVLALLA